MNTNQKYNRLKVALAERDHTNKWLAEKLGRPEMTVSRWASNKSQPSIEQLFEIAKILDMDARYLLYSPNDVTVGSMQEAKMDKLG